VTAVCTLRKVAADIRLEWREMPWIGRYLSYETKFRYGMFPRLASCAQVALLSRTITRPPRMAGSTRGYRRSASQ
jgi:hypothetical protein